MLLFGVCQSKIGIFLTRAYYFFVEIFSLAAQPWGDLESSTQAAQRIQEGVELFKPTACPLPVYELMIQCWKNDSHTRLRGPALTEEFQKYISSSGEKTKFATLMWPSINQMKGAQAWRPSLDYSTVAAALTIDASLNATEEALKAIEAPREKVLRNEQLTRGAFGPIYSGHYTHPTRGVLEVAIKALTHTDKDSESKFLEEARLMAGLKHTNLVELYAVVTKAMPYLLVLELVDGMNLLEYLHYIRENDLDGTLTPMDMTDIATQIADVMSYLSRNGVVHRDVCTRFAASDGIQRTCIHTLS